MTIGPGNVRYTYAQLEGIWVQAGGNKQYANMAAAIAMAESGGNSMAYGVNTNGTTDRGLWEINSSNGALSTFDVMGNARAAVQMSNRGVNWRPWCTAYADGACGTRGGAYLGAGSPYLRFLQGSFAGTGGGGASPPPDTTAPINATQAAQNQTNQTGSQTVEDAAYACNWLGHYLEPGYCNAASQGPKTPIPTPNKLVQGSIEAVINGILNPLVSVVAGVLGMTGGAIMVLGGIFMVVRQTQTYQETKQGATQAAGAAMFLAGPEAGAAGEMAAGTSSRQTYRIGRMTTSRTQRGPSQPRPMNAEDQINAEARRYRAYSQAMAEWRKAGGRIG